MKVDKYLIPNIDDLLTKVSGGRLFTTPDLSNVYQQVVLDEESRKLTNINTTKGLFEYVRLPYGVSSAPGISAHYGTAAAEHSYDGWVPR